MGQSKLDIEATPWKIDIRIDRKQFYTFTMAAIDQYITPKQIEALDSILGRIRKLMAAQDPTNALRFDSHPIIEHANKVINDHKSRKN